MNEIAQISIYVIAIVITFMAFWKVDFAKFIRVDQRQFAIFVYVLLSLAIGFLVGKVFVEIGDLLLESVKKY